MNSGEKLNNHQENREQKSREENIRLIEQMPVMLILAEMGIAARDMYNGNMDDDTVNDLRIQLEERLANPPAPAEDTPVSTPEQASTGTPAKEEGPVIVPPTAPEGVGSAEGEPVPEGDTPEPETANDDDEPVEPVIASADTPEDPAAKPEKKKNIFMRNRRIGAAVLVVLTTATLIAGQLGMFQKNYADANEVPTAPPYNEQIQEEVSYEFEDFESTDYRNLFLNAEGDGYNEDKQSYRYNEATGQWEQESNWQYDISPRVLDDFKLDWEAGNHEDAELGARATINNQLVREPEFLAIVANQLSDEQKAELGLDGITTVKGMEAALENEATLAQAEAGIKAILENSATGEFTTFTGNATNYYLRSNNEANIQNDSGNIEAARTATRYYNNVDVFIIHVNTGKDAGHDIIFDIDCLNVVVPVEEGTPEEDVEPGTPIITIEITEDNPDTGNETGTETGEETGDETGDETGNETGDETGDETGSETGDETGDETGNETGSETGSETGNETGDETGNETGTETGNETGDETGNETGTETGVETGNENALEEKDPQQIEDNMQTGDESTNTVTPLPAGPETDRPDTSETEYNPDTNQFEDVDAEPERPAEDITSEDGSGDTVAEIIDNADQTHAEDVNLTPEDQQAADAQAEANANEITDTPELSTEEAGDWFNNQFGTPAAAEPQATQATTSNEVVTDTAQTAEPAASSETVTTVEPAAASDETATPRP